MDRGRRKDTGYRPSSQRQVTERRSGRGRKSRTLRFSYKIIAGFRGRGVFSKVRHHHTAFFCAHSSSLYSFKIHPRIITTNSMGQFTYINYILLMSRRRNNRIKYFLFALFCLKIQVLSLTFFSHRYGWNVFFYPIIFATHSLTLKTLFTLENTFIIVYINVHLSYANCKPMKHVCLALY